VIDSSDDAPPGTTWNSQYSFLDVHGSGVVLDRVYVKGGVDFTGQGTLTIRHSIVEGGHGTWFVILGRTAGSTIDVQDSTLRWRPNAASSGEGSGTVQVSASLRLIALRNDISGMPDGIQLAGSNSRIEGNWIHDLPMLGTYPNNTHNDGIQMYDGANVVIANNRFETGARAPFSNAAIFVQPGGGNSVSNLVIEGNYLDGGAYSLFMERGQGSTTGVVVRNNVWGPNRLYGPVMSENGVTIAEWANNRYASGGEISRP
jgi:hypothetical protein